VSLLEVRDLKASYGGSPALFGVDLSVEEGEVVALMGRNGMGKSTTIRCICRMMPIDAGTLSFAGQDLRSLPSHAAARLGIGLVPEGRRCFPNLSVRENLIAAARPGHWDAARVATLFPRLAERSGQSAATLSGGEQQMLAIGRALMTNPRLLILDEATEGLAPLVRQEIREVIAGLSGQSGLSILIVDKSLRELSHIAQRVVILERGRSVLNDAISAVTPQVADRYLGV